MARRETARTMLAASGLTVLGALAPFLLGAQAVLVQRELGFGAAGLGVAVAVFFASAALTTVLGTRHLLRLGLGHRLVVAGALVALGSLGLGLLARSWAQLVLAMAVLGAANAVCQATSNAAVATALPRHRRGLGFGIKQSAVPTAIMLGGLAVPTTTALLGWRSTYLVTGALGLLVAVLGLIASRWARAGRARGPAGRARGTAYPAVLDRAPTGPLVLVALAIMLASAGANFIGAYLASWAHQVGLTVEEAGLLIAAGSGSSIVLRIVHGHRADLRHGGNLGPIALQMLGGGVCLVLLGAVPQAWAVVVLGLLAFAVGWSWPGLLLYAVARVGRDAPAQAASVVQAGAFVGGALGPLVLGALVEVVSFRGAWWAAGLCFALAALLTVLARSGFRRDLVRRPPAEPFGYGGGRERPRLTAGPAPDPAARTVCHDEGHASRGVGRSGGPDAGRGGPGAATGHR